MNILILNWRDTKNPQSGGAEIILYELAKRLAKKNHSVTWFCSSFSGAAKEESYDSIKIVRAGNKYSVYWHAFLYYSSLKVEPDIVLDCINTICWQTPLYIPKEKRILYANQSAREVFFYEYPFLFALFCFFIEPLQYLSYSDTKTICYSNSIREDLVSFGIPYNKISVFSLGIDHARYTLGAKSKTPIFIYVGRFVKNKRIDVSVKAMQYVAKRYPETKLFLIGYGTEEKNLRTLINNLKLEGNVFIVNKDNVFLEKNAKDVKTKFMQEAWGLLLLSAKEGWGMVVTEAAACGTPSIVADVSGLKDSVVNNETGIILSKNPHPLEVGVTMLRIIEEKNLRQKFFKKTVTWGKKFFWEDSFKTFYSYIKEN